MIFYRVNLLVLHNGRGRHGHDHMVVEFTTTYVISAYHHWHCKFVSRSGEVYLIQHYVIKFVSDLQQDGGFPPGTSVSTTNKTNHHDIAEILLKVVLNTISLTLYNVLK